MDFNEFAGVIYKKKRRRSRFGRFGRQAIFNSPDGPKLRKEDAFDTTRLITSPSPEPPRVRACARFAMRINSPSSSRHARHMESTTFELGGRNRRLAAFRRSDNLFIKVYFGPLSKRTQLIGTPSLLDPTNLAPGSEISMGSSSRRSVPDRVSGDRWDCANPPISLGMLIRRGGGPNFPEFPRFFDTFPPKPWDFGLVDISQRNDVISPSHDPRWPVNSERWGKRARDLFIWRVAIPDHLPGAIRGEISRLRRLRCPIWIPQEFARKE